MPAEPDSQHPLILTIEYGQDHPDMYDIMLGTVKMNHVYGAVLIEIKRELMPRWQRLCASGSWT